MSVSVFANAYGFAIGSAMVLCIVASYFLLKFKGYNPDITLDIAIVCIPLAVIGARFYYIFFDIVGGDGTFSMWFSNFKWLGIQTYADGSWEFKGLAGLAIYGGLIFAVLGAFIVRHFNKKKKNPKDHMTIFQMFDFFFVLIILAQGIGRWGNYFNKEAYGNIITNPDWQWFPAAVNVNGVYYQATFFYEFAWNVIGFGILFWLYFGKRKSFDGFVFSCYCFWYGLGRTFIEGMRSDSLMLGNIKFSQLFSILLVFFAIGNVAYYVYNAKKHNKKIFIFVEQSLLSTEYYGYDKTIMFIKNNQDKVSEDAVQQDDVQECGGEQSNDIENKEFID